MSDTAAHSNPQRLRSGLSLNVDQATAIQQSITNLAASTPANLVLLADMTGQLVAVHGDAHGANLLALSSLVVGDQAASQEVARLLGEYHPHQVVLREGHQTHNLITEAGSHLVLFMQVSNEVPLGWARMAVLHAARTIAEIAVQAPAGSPEATAPRAALFEIDQDDFSGLLDEAIDSLWTED